MAVSTLKANFFVTILLAFAMLGFIQARSIRTLRSASNSVEGDQTMMSSGSMAADDQSVEGVEDADGDSMSSGNTEDSADADDSNSDNDADGSQPEDMNGASSGDGSQSDGDSNSMANNPAQLDANRRAAMVAVTTGVDGGQAAGFTSSVITDLFQATPATERIVEATPSNKWGEPDKDKPDGTTRWGEPDKDKPDEVNVRRS